MTTYADSSFIVSLYVLHANSSRAFSLLKNTPPPLLTSELGAVEMTNAVSLLRFRGTLNSVEAGAVLSTFAQDLKDGVVRIVPIPRAAFEQARQLALNQTPRFGTRTVDILHVASALALSADSFYTFDQRQARLATALGLSVA